MKRRSSVALMGLLVALSAVAQPPAPPFIDFVKSIYWNSCAEMKAACEDATPADVLNGALTRPSLLGTCYAHDGIDTPTYRYAGHYYIKQSWRPGAAGYDGGTGAIGWPKSVQTEQEAAAEAGEILRDLCRSGACCCPDLPAVLPCKPNAPVVAYDPMSGTCCRFANRCTVPERWELASGTGTDPRCH